MSKPWENSSGCADPTAYADTRTISRDEQRVTDLVHCIRYIAKMAGFEIINRVEFREPKRGRTYR